MPLTDTDLRSGCERFATKEMGYLDSGPQICIVDHQPPKGVFPYLLYGMLGTRAEEISELTRRVCEGLNRRQYNYGR